MFERMTKPKKAVHRMIRAAFMNLAYKKAVTIPGTWTTPPVGYADLTDENLLSHLSTDGVTNTTLANKVQIKIDLGQSQEVYQINVHNITGTGIKANNTSNAGTCKLQVSTDDTNWTTLATQTPALTTFVDMDVNYDGDGVAARYVRLYLENDDTYFMTIDIAEMEVFGS